MRPKRAAGEPFLVLFSDGSEEVYDRSYREGDEIHFWKKYYIVDSKIMKCFIKKSHGFITFVAIRIEEIQESNEPNQWLWRESRSNVADWIVCRKDPVDLGPRSKLQNMLSESFWDFQKKKEIYKEKCGTVKK